jgi:hypothetical protein
VYQIDLVSTCPDAFPRHPPRVARQQQAEHCHFTSSTNPRGPKRSVLHCVYRSFKSRCQSRAPPRRPTSSSCRQHRRCLCPSKSHYIIAFIVAYTVSCCGRKKHCWRAVDAHSFPKLTGRRCVEPSASRGERGAWQGRPYTAPTNEMSRRSPSLRFPTIMSPAKAGSPSLGLPLVRRYRRHTNGRAAAPA